MADNQSVSNNGELQLGLFINDQYVAVKKIGVGGFGIVWQAYDFSLRNFIAIKELLPEYAQPKFVEMFYKEALIAKNIIHDNIVRVQHFWQGSNGSYYVVLDYVRGVDLENLIKKCNDMNTKIPWQISTFICMSVLKAIDYANRIARDSITGNAYGIVYRDISPGNVLLSFDGNIKLSDFGIAKTADEIRDSIPEKVITGKYPYMSPEQIKGLPDIDHRTDIYSVALLYFEMLTGQRLYQGSNEEIKNQVLNKKFDPAELKLDASVPAEIGDIISKALEKDRDNRYERAIEMYRDIRRVLKGMETDELSVELSDFILKMMRESVAGSEKLIEKVKTLTVQEVGQTEGIRKITCQDFIVGQKKNLGAVVPPVAGAGVAAQGVVAAGAQNVAAQGQAQNVSPQSAQPKGEEKGKTVFEEVGDWLFNKFDEMKKSLIRIIIAILLALLIFGILDVFLLQLTPFGKSIYSRLYPPDVVITTIPAGAVVSMKTKEGEVILNNVSSNNPIPVRKVTPKTYIVTAIKEGFKPVQRVVQIEQSDKGKKIRKEKIEIMFDFLLNVDSEPRGASVYIDGNKFGVTPCKAQLLAGAHTVKLMLEGFDNLGYDSASGGKEGQCDIDFTKSVVEEMFSGVDRRFWNCELKNIEGENIFSVTGSLFKKVKIDSEPRGMMVHVQGESQPRGDTPLNTLFKVGEYKVRFLDPSAKYGEALKDLEVNKDSKTDLFIKMNKIVSFRVKSKDSPNDTFLTKVTISNNDLQLTKDISTSKPIRIPLPVAVYNITFHGDSEYKACKLTNVDINETSAIVGELEYLRVPLSLKATDSKTANPLSGAYVWLNKKMIGKTDKSGIYTGNFKPGRYEFKFVAKGYKEQNSSVEVISGKKSEVQIIMEPEVTAEATIVPIDANAYVPSGTNSNLDISDNIIPTKDKVTPEPPKTKKVTPKKEKKKVTPTTTADDDTTTENQIVVCLNCGYVNTAPAGKKLRFCINCAKPLK
ncbi:MAG: serine/threonine protein kinase [Elusimicrobia bacterium]|nr:serine/threonine protein kinase [Elusimicrobiota bacterium]